MRAPALWTAVQVVCLAVPFVMGGPEREIWLDVPYIRQSHDGCGSACAAMVIRYWDAQFHRQGVVREDEAGIYRKLYAPRAGGIPATSLERYFKEQGFRVFTLKGSWQVLLEHLLKGRPLIVCLKGPSSHYVVVTGIDTEQGIVLVNDPARRKLLKLKRAEFEKSWVGADDWTLLAIP